MRFRILCVVFPLLLFASPWPQFMYDAQHSGRTDIVVQDNLSVAWTYTPPQSAPAWMWNQPVLDDDGNIYYAAGNYFISVDPNGAHRWDRYTSHTFGGPAAVYGDTVYFACSEGALFAYTTDGTQLWTFPMIHPVNGGPIVGSDGTIYIGDDITVQDTAYVYAVNPDGTQKWSTPFDSSNGIYTTPALDPDEDKLYVTAGDWYVHGLSTSDGSILWSYYLQSNFNINYSSPSVAEWNGTKYVFCGDLGNFSGYATWYALTDSGVLHWNVFTDNSIQHTAAFDIDGSSYLGSNDGVLRKVDINGDPVWSRNFGDVYISNPIIDGAGNVLIGTEDNHLYVLNGTDGSILQNITLSGDVSCPIIGADGEVYVVVGSGYLVCLKNSSVVEEYGNSKESCKLEVFPNPSYGIFNLRYNAETVPCRLEVYNTAGRKVCEKEFSNTATWDPLDNPPGIYFIRVKPAVGEEIKTKLILLSH